MGWESNLSQRRRRRDDDGSDCSPQRKKEQHERKRERGRDGWKEGREKKERGGEEDAEKKRALFVVVVVQCIAVWRRGRDNILFQRFQPLSCFQMDIMEPCPKKKERRKEDIWRWSSCAILIVDRLPYHPSKPIGPDRAKVERESRMKLHKKWQGKSSMLSVKKPSNLLPQKNARSISTILLPAIPFSSSFPYPSPARKRTHLSFFLFPPKPSLSLFVRRSRWCSCSFFFLFVRSFVLSLSLSLLVCELQKKRGTKKEDEGK